MNRKRIALITAWFPPRNGVAVNRMSAFASHLSEDYDVEVFALDSTKRSVKELGCTVHYNTDSRLMQLLKSNTNDSKIVHNFRTLLRIIALKLIRNPLKSWQRSTVSDLIAVHRSRPFDLIISSYAPKEAHQAALGFLETFPGVPWIADMRDEMSANPHNLPHLNDGLRKLEAEIAEKASAITSVSKPIVDDFRVVCPGVAYYEEIRNGYNHEIDIPEYVKSGEIFHIGYFGSFYGPIKPGTFLEALAVVKKREPEFRFKFTIAGAHRNFSIPAEIAGFVSVEPSVPYEKAIMLMAKQDALVLISPASERKGVFTGKLFDYLSVRRTILGLVDTNDVAAHLIYETHAGYIGNCLDLEENVRVITESWNDWKNGTLNIISAEDAAMQHRRHQSRKLKALIERLFAA